MSKLITQIKRLALALCFATPLVSWAAEKANPVTGTTETYANVFTGETAEWDSAEHWDTGARPFVSGGAYSSALVDGKAASTETSIDGWNLQVGAYNGASITWSTLGKIQGDTGMWMTVDGTSSIAINGWGEGNLGQDGKTLSYYVANKDGVIWNVDLDSGWDQGLTMNYYLAGTGSVSYQKLERAAQVIKQADVTLSGTKELTNKKLVSFTSTDKIFTADAAIKVKNGDNVLKTVYLTSVTSGATTLTTDGAVGTCELVQASDGVYLYWVDGDPADVVVDEKTYKPSISLNFTNGNGLTTGADVGLSDYEVPGTSWNNLTVGNTTYSTINAVDATGAASELSGVSVTVSGTRGSWSCSDLASASNPLHGYIDENDNNLTPTVTVTGIPYYKYRVIVYHSTDTENVPFGYDTINGTNYTYVDGNLTEGDTAWGSSGPDAGANAIEAGVNALVTGELSGSTLTVVGHRGGGDSSARGCIAAIQIIEVKPDAGDDGLVIEVSGDTEYTVSEAKELTGTVYITGSGTLTLAGENKISAATINVGDLVTLVVNADRLDATTFTGAGTVVYDGTKPASGKGWTESSAWKGTVWVKNIPTSSNERKDWDPAPYGNADSTLRFTNVNLYFPNNTTTAFPGTIDLDGAGMNICDGYGGSIATFARLTGSGTLSTTGGSSNGNGLTINDASGFTGTITLTKYKVIVGTSTGTSASGVLQVESGKSITVAGATAPGGFVVNGTLVANGTLASSASPAVSGAGTVVFGGVPSPTGDTWWKNSAWTGTVEIKGASIAGDTYAFNDYGNATSTVKLTNCSGWLKPNYTCVPALEIGGTFSWNDGSSGLNNTFKVATLKGNGTISIPNQGAATAVWQITDDWSGFTGVVVGNNGAAKRVLVFGSTLPATATAGVIYVSEGATLNLDNASSAWWGVGMGFVVDGTVKASARNKWGGGTYMTLGDTGVLEFVSTANTDDQNTEMGNITGTGTLKFSSSAGWRSFPKADANMPATTLTIQTELADSLIVPTKNDGETVIGNLAGSKNVRSDWSNNGENGRTLTVTQSKDTEWQGKFVANRITQFNVVAPTEGTPGTLTLSGTQDATIPMQVDGSVNLTGTWVGATTVAGTIGGTGTLTGDLTFSDGATFKANATALTVSGTVTIPAGEGESLTIVATDLDADEVTILSSESITTETDVSKVTVDGLYTVEPVAGALKLVSTKVAVTIPAIANATVTVSVGGKTIGTEAGTYNVAPDAVVTATYAAAQGYEISGQTVYTIDVANSETTFDPAGTTEVKQYVAYVVFQVEQGESFVDVTNYYTTVAVAIDAAKALKRTIVLIAQPDAEDTYEIAVGETINVKKGEFTFDGIIFPTGPQYNNTTTEIAGVTQYKCTTFTVTVQYPGQEPVGMTGQLIQILGGLYSGYVPGYAGTVVTVLDGSDATVGDAMPDVFTYNSEAHTYTLKTMVASYNNGYTTTYYPTLASAITNVPVNGTITLVAACPDALVLEKAVTIDVGETVSFGAGIDITVDGGYVITDETTEINKSYNTTWVVDVLDSETTPRRVKYGYGATRTVKMDYLSGDGNVVVTIGDLVRQVPEAVAAEMGGPSGAYFYVKDGADLSFTVTPYGDRLVSSATIKVGEADPVDLPAPVGDVYTATVTGDSVINVTFAMAQAKIGTTLYPTLQDALNVGGEVTLLADVASTTYMYVGSGKTVDLDLNGKTITSTGHGIVVWGTLKVDGGTINAAYSPILVSGGTVTVDGGTYTSTANSALAFNTDSTGGTLTINDATVQAQEFCVLTGRSSNNTITINGGTFTSIDNAVIGDNGTSGYSGNEFTINAGTFNGGITSANYIACGIYVANDDTVTVNGGTFNITGGCGIAVRAGVVSITGGTINATGTVTGWVGDKKRNLPCAAVIYDVNPGAYPGYDSATSKVAITGGTFNSAVAAVQMLGEGLITSTDNTLTVADDYKWAATETVGVYKLAVKSGIDPTDPTSAQEVVIEPTGDADADKAAAIAQAEVTVPEGEVASTGVNADTYKTYFNYTATDKGNGVYEVTVDPVKDLNEEVVLPEEVQVGTETITQTEELLEAATDAQVEEATVPAVPGIYYSMVAANNLAFEEAVEGDQTLATGQTVTIAKPEQLPTGNAVFFRVKASATPNN